MMTDRARKRLIYIRRVSDDDIVPMDWVRLITGGRCGFVESVREGHATVNWLRGHKDILPCAVLIRVTP